MSIFYRKKFKRRKRKVEIKRGFLRPRKTPRGPKIYLPHKKTVRFEHSSTFWPKFYCFLFFIAIIGILYLILFSPVFQCKQINILNTEEELSQRVKAKIQDNLKNKKFYTLPANNYLLIDLAKHESLIKEEFPEIKEIKIIKNFPNLLKVKIDLKKIKYIWVQGDLESNLTKESLNKRLEQIENKKYEEITNKDECAEEDEECKNIFLNPFYNLKNKEDVVKKIEELEEKERKIKYFLMDEEGVLGKEIQKGELNLPLFCDRSAQNAASNTKPLEDEYFNFLTKVFNQFEEKTNFQIDYLCVPSKQGKETYIRTKQGVGIYFSTTYALDRQFAILEEVLKKLEKEGDSAKEYIDLRIDGKVYYK